MQLTERCDLWRMVGTYDQGRQMTAVLTHVPCLRVPVSSFDKVAAALVARSAGNSEGFRPEGRESTDLFLVPAWTNVEAEDELRQGRHVAVTGTVEPNRYVVNGVREYSTLGYQDTIAVFCARTD